MARCEWSSPVSFFFERQAGDTLIHLVDGNAISLGAHVPQMSITADAVDITATQKPESASSVRLGGTRIAGSRDLNRRASRRLRPPRMARRNSLSMRHP